MATQLLPQTASVPSSVRAFNMTNRRSYIAERQQARSALRESVEYINAALRASR